MLTGWKKKTHPGQIPSPSQVTHKLTFFPNNVECPADLNMETMQTPQRKASVQSTFEPEKIVEYCKILILEYWKFSQVNNYLAYCTAAVQFLEPCNDMYGEYAYELNDNWLIPCVPQTQRVYNLSADQWQVHNWPHPICFPLREKITNNKQEYKTPPSSLFLEAHSNISLCLRGCTSSVTMLA